MARSTRDDIKWTFLELLDQRPLAKITVKDIVKTCGINRNSFYYHFQDLPTLIEEIMQELTDALIERYPTLDSMEDGINAIFEMLFESRRSIYHIYNSVNRDIFERHLMRNCRYAVSTYLRTAFPDLAISDQDREVIVRFLTDQCFGAVLDALERNEDIGEARAYLKRVTALTQGLFEEVIRRCEESNVES